jgi:hypothetical protein
MRRGALLCLMALAALAALGLQGLIVDVQSARPGEYFLSDVARSRLGPVSVTTAIVLAVLGGYFFQVAPFLAGLAMIAVFPLAAVYEATRFEGSHNLIPFELLSYVLLSLPVAYAAWVGRALARRNGRHSWWDGARTPRRE